MHLLLLSRGCEWVNVSSDTGSPGQRAVKRLRVCVCVCACMRACVGVCNSKGIWHVKTCVIRSCST